MPLPLTDENRGIASRPKPAAPGPAERGLTQEPEFAARPGPLTMMTAAVERARQSAAAGQRSKEADAREREFASMVKRMPSLVAAARVRFLHDDHHEQTTGANKGSNGIGYGVEWPDAYARGKLGLKPDANFDSLSDEQKRLYKRYYIWEKKRVEEAGLKEISCLTMMDTGLEGYRDALSQLGLSKAEQSAFDRGLRAAQDKARDAAGVGVVGAKGSTAVYGGRGTVLLEELRSKFGFKTVFVDAQPRSSAEHPYWNQENYTSFKDAMRTGVVPAKSKEHASVTGKDSGKRIDARVGLDRFVRLDQRKNMTARSRGLWDELKNTEFALGVTDSGFHTFVLSRGTVYQVHWDKAATDPRLTEAEPLDSFLKWRTGEWGSAVIAVPPATLRDDNPRPAPAAR